MVFIFNKNLTGRTFFGLRRITLVKSKQTPFHEKPIAFKSGRVIVICAVLFAFASGGRVQAQPASGIADRILNALKGASEARTENAREAQTWKEERQRLTVLHGTIRQGITQHEARAKTLRAEITELSE